MEAGNLSRARLVDAWPCRVPQGERHRRDDRDSLIASRISLKQWTPHSDVRDFCWSPL
jgi:hypothetical protein